jgi:hypothetical protein
MFPYILSTVTVRETNNLVGNLTIVWFGVCSISPAKSLKIIPLSKQNLEQAARIYAQGLLMEEPPGSTEPLEELITSLELHLQIALGVKENRIIWLAMSHTLVKGLLDFYQRPAELFVRFICAIPPRQGTGTWLLHQLAVYGVQHQIDSVKATVSSLDSRAQQFYFQHLGFQKVGSRIDEPGLELFIAEISSQTLYERKL